ncbi:integrin alpha-8-like isoform X2 [Cylas formicarius]|uniref:integrin alpha-8-like isoform X2 n=1 Tax=Cylas formicarius TaxID=197179 RepID=UPI00295840A0|nr:integrin alpha-8-like isoform X2 [Cylas formicarius]
MLVSYFLLWSKLFLSVNAFNIDVRHPIIIVNPDKLQNKTYFGYSLGLFSENSGGWITAIGAPATTKDGIANVGTLYTCPFLENCTEVHYKTISGYPHKLSGNSWIGGSIDVSNKFRKLCVSSFRWYQEVALPAPFIIMTGGLFLTNLNKTSVASLSPLKNDLHTSSKVFYYGEAAVGFSIHFPSNADELLLGAPGINNFLGSVVKIDNFFTKQHQVVEPAGDDYNELGGYSVTSGYFYNRNELYYATGAPRGTYGNGNTLNGLVVLFIVGYEFNRFGELRSITKAIISGTQVGEYFGASLGSGDLDSDGLTDLIIGAPFRKNGLDGYNHGSVYIYYGAKKRLKHNKETDKLDGTVSGGLFGSSIMYLSDINKDGYGEIAISAPYEDKTGAIYIYSYRKYQLILIQKILGKDVAPEIRGFGISFSRPADIDGNGFVDFAVGSYESGHVVLLRSQPVVAIIARLKTTQIPRHSKQSSFQVCFFYSDYNEEKLEITREVMLDKMLGRAQVLDKKEIFNITILYKKEKCETIKFAIKKNRINWREPITIAVSYHLVGELQQKPLAPIYIHPDIKVGNDTFCRSCPVLDESRSSKRTILGNMQWSQFCGNDNRACKSKLSIFGRFSKLGNNHSYVLGSSDFVTLNVEVENEGDPLYGTLLEITLPVSMGLRQKPSICQIELNNKVVCEIGDNGEELSKMFSHDFELDMRTINDGTERNQLNISLKAHSTSANQPTSVLNMTITLVRETDFIITGLLEQSWVR